MQHLLNNEYGYRFHVRLYPTLVQGDQAAPALRMAVAAIDPDRFDAVVLIRGGGGRLDLEPFNDLELCRLLARLPIPVLTGIGHDVDVSVADLIAHGAHKTPTAVADHLIDRCAFFESGLNGFLVGIQQRMQELFAGNRERLATHAADLRERPASLCRKRQGELQAAAGQFGRLSTAVLQQRAQHMATLRATLAAEALRGVRLLLRGMEGMQEAVRLLAPDQVLQRGYSITRADGAAVRHAADLRPGDELETQFANGRAWSTIQRIDPHG
jgi:exodeoxyribonuclease VII large subunit